MAHLAVLGMVLLAFVAVIANIVCLLLTISKIVVPVLFISILAIISAILFAADRLAMHLSIKLIVNLFKCVLILFYK